MNLKAALRGVSPGLAAATLCLGVGMSVNAQVQTKTEQVAGQAKSQVTVEKATVVSVDGNDLIVKMDDGTIRHFPNVPESARATVDGQQLGIHDLKPGMHLERTITSTTTPLTITTVQTVTGTVWNVTPPTLVILTLEDGKNQSFKIPKGQSGLHVLACVTPKDRSARPSKPLRTATAGPMEFPSLTLHRWQKTGNGICGLEVQSGLRAGPRGPPARMLRTA